MSMARRTPLAEELLKVQEGNLPRVSASLVGSGKVRNFALYGETTGETDEFGLPVRFNRQAVIGRACRFLESFSNTSLSS